jgi:hypothetical protein
MPYHPYPVIVTKMYEVAKYSIGTSEQYMIMKETGLKGMPRTENVTTLAYELLGMPYQPYPIISIKLIFVTITGYGW